MNASNLFLSLILHLGNLFLIVQLHFSKLFLILKSGVNHTSRGSISTSTLPSIKLRKCSSKIITSILSFISGRLATKSNQIKQLIRNGRSASLQRTLLTKNQAVATSQEAVQNQNEPQLRDENAHNDKSVHGVLNPTYQAGLRRDAVQPDIEAERKKRDEIEAGKSYCSRRFGGATCDDKSAQIYARFDKNDWRIQPAEFYRFHDAEVNTFGYF